MDTKDLLLLAAKKVFAQKGFDGATIKDLADEAGVNVSLVSYHFGGKEALYRACLESFGRSRLAATERVLKKPTSLEDFKTRLTLFCEEFFEAHLAEPETTSILHRECSMELPVAKDLFKEVFIPTFAKLIEFFESGKKQGYLNQLRDPFVSAGLFFGSLVHVIRTDALQREYFGKSLSDAKYRGQIIDIAINTFLYGSTK